MTDMIERVARAMFAANGYDLEKNADLCEWRAMIDAALEETKSTTKGE